MALGLEWQNGHVEQGLSVQARVHQGSLGVLYDRGGVLRRKRQSSKYVQQAIHVTGGPLNTFLPGTRRVALPTPAPSVPPSCPPYLPQVQPIRRPTSVLSELLIKQDSIHKSTSCSEALHCCTTLQQTSQTRPRFPVLHLYITLSSARLVSCCIFCPITHSLTHRLVLSEFLYRRALHAAPSRQAPIAAPARLAVANPLPKSRSRKHPDAPKRPPPKMSATATPTKRRVLGSLDANVQMSPRSPGLGASPLKKASREASLSLSRRASPSPRKQASREGTPRKRPLEEAAAALQQPAVKKLCSDDAAGTVPALEQANAAATAAASTGRQQTAQSTDEVRRSCPLGLSSCSMTFDHANMRRGMMLTYCTERPIRVTAYHYW